MFHLVIPSVFTLLKAPISAFPVLFVNISAWAGFRWKPAPADGLSGFSASDASPPDASRLVSPPPLTVLLVFPDGWSSSAVRPQEGLAARSFPSSCVFGAAGCGPALGGHRGGTRVLSCPADLHPESKREVSGLEEALPVISSLKASVSVPTAHVHTSNVVQNSCEMGVLQCWRALGSYRSCCPAPPHRARGGRSRTNAVPLGGWRALASALPDVGQGLWHLSASKGDRVGVPRPGRFTVLDSKACLLSGALTRAAGTAAPKATGLETQTCSPPMHTHSVRTLSPTPRWDHRAASLWLFSRCRQLVPFLVGPVCASSWRPRRVLGGVSQAGSSQGNQRSTGMGVPSVGSRLSFLGDVSACVRLCVGSPSPGAAAGRLPPGLSTSVSLALFASIIVSFSCSWVLSYFVLRPLFSCFYIYIERESAGEWGGSRDWGSGTRRSARSLPQGSTP